MNTMKRAAEEHMRNTFNATTFGWTDMGDGNHVASFLSLPPTNITCRLVVAGVVNFCVYESTPMTLPHTAVIVKHQHNLSIADFDGHFDRQALADEMDPNYV